MIPKTIALFPLCLWIVLNILMTGCSPSYTWGYASTIHPQATSAYIHAVMAREAGNYALALTYYDLALRRTPSESVRAERDEVARILKNHSH